MSFLQDLHSAHVERVARMSRPLPGARPPRAKPSFRVVVISDGRQVLPPRPVPNVVFTPSTAPVRTAPLAITVQRIVREVIKEFGIDITASCRQRPYVIPRHIAMYLARKLTGNSLPLIGRKMGGMDHTTVLNGSRQGAMYAASPEFSAKVAAIEAALGASS